MRDSFSVVSRSELSDAVCCTEKLVVGVGATIKASDIIGRRFIILIREEVKRLSEIKNADSDERTLLFIYCQK
jgi:hypothetical protein